MLRSSQARGQSATGFRQGPQQGGAGAKPYPYYNYCKCGFLFNWHALVKLYADSVHFVAKLAKAFL